jgi:hypothetical protein
LKNALIEDLQGDPTEAWLADIENQLNALAEDHDRDKKRIETENARRAYCAKRGMRYVAHRQGKRA